MDIAVLDTGVDFNHADLNVHRYAYCATQGPFNASCSENDSGAIAPQAPQAPEPTLADMNDDGQLDGLICCYSI